MQFNGPVRMAETDRPQSGDSPKINGALLVFFQDRAKYLSKIVTVFPQPAFSRAFSTAGEVA